MPPRAWPSCERVGSRWFIAGAPEAEGSTKTMVLHEVDLSESAAKPRAFRLVGTVPSISSGAFRLGACHGFLFAAFADSTLLFLDPRDASVKFAGHLGVRLTSPLLASDCSTCTSVLFGAPNDSSPASNSRLFSLTGTVPLAAASCTHPSEGELPAVPYSLVFAGAPSDSPPSPSPSPPLPSWPEGAAPPTPTPTPSGPPSPSPRSQGPPATPDETSSRAVAVAFWLSVRATPEECASYLQRHDAASASQGLARLVSAAARLDIGVGAPRVRVAEVRCGSILFRVEVLKAAAAAAGAGAAAGAAAAPDVFILEAIANLTRWGGLLLPGLEGRPVSAMFNATFAPDVPASGADAAALARGEAITMIAPAPAPAPSPLPAENSGASGTAASSGSSGGGSPVSLAAGAAAAGLVVAAALIAGLYVLKRRRRRAYSAGTDGGLAPPFAPGLPYTTSLADFGGGLGPAPLLQTTSAFDPLTNGTLPSSVWIDFPALSGEALDLLRLVAPGSTSTDPRSSKGAAGDVARSLTLTQRAAISPPKPIPPELLSRILEPLGLLGEGAFGRVYAVEVPQSAATWLPAANPKPDETSRPGEGPAEAREGRRTIRRAIKEVSLGDRDVAAREIHGARLQMLCDHPNVLRCEALFASRFKLYIVLPLAETSLSALLASRGVLPADLITSFAFQIACGMSYLHHELARPVAHRDLKPQNILIFSGEDGSPPVLRVCDFGISRHVETAKSLRGTLVYLPPEIYTAENHPVKADVWAFGIILMEMATGAKPYGGTMIGPEQLAKGQPYSRAAFAVVPDPLRPLARACLDKKPLHRPSFLEIRQALARTLPRPRPAAASPPAPCGLSTEAARLEVVLDAEAAAPSSAPAPTSPPTPVGQPHAQEPPGGVPPIATDVRSVVVRVE
eukprot:tig00000204_g17701.t1